MFHKCFIAYFVFFFNDTATTEIYTLSLHDALPISPRRRPGRRPTRRAPSTPGAGPCRKTRAARRSGDRKSTRLNSSHANISYAVFCLKKKKYGTVMTSPFDVALLSGMRARYLAKHT